MNCKETEKLIPVFIQNELNYRELEKFLDHIKNCPECKEEMSIQFLVAEGMQRLEDGGPLELEKDLKTLLIDSEKAVSRHRYFWRIILGVELGALFILAILVLVFLL